MKILILGGTKFLGRHLVESARRRNHQVTLFHRGQTNPELFPEVEKIHGDRDGQLAGLLGRKWDVVVDTSGYLPRVVRQSAEFLQHAAEQYIFISSISVYADFSKVGMNENVSVATLEEESEEVEKHYGALKALCEQEVQQIWKDRSMIVRPGLIVGPHDPTDRFTYWPYRFSQGGDMLVPGDPSRPLQFIDVRDLSEWIVEAAEKKLNGVFNATGPTKLLTMNDFINIGMDACSTSCNPVWVEEDFLRQEEVGEWMELPIWISKKMNWPGFMTMDVSKAIANGLTCRPLNNTMADTLNWVQSLPKDRTWKAGLAKEREDQLLKKWMKMKEFD